MGLSSPELSGPRAGWEHSSRLAWPLPTPLSFETVQMCSDASPRLNQKHCPQADSIPRQSLPLLPFAVLCRPRRVPGAGCRHTAQGLSASGWMKWMNALLYSAALKSHS